MDRERKLVVLSGAGISAESGLQTFRDAGGLWEGHEVMDVASPRGWQKHPKLVLDFYNQRRRQLLQVKPNQAHYDLARLQEQCQTTIITQNVDDLHERAGSKQVIHLHGHLLTVRSAINPLLTYRWTKDVEIGDLAEDGSQLRPAIVWFGESVPLMRLAVEEVQSADVLLIVGTSLQVYPAAGLLQFVTRGVPVFYIDPKPGEVNGLSTSNHVHMIVKDASEGVKEAIDLALTYIKK
jgi:NAD-dependent deacetylase